MPADTSDQVCHCRGFAKISRPNPGMALQSVSACHSLSLISRCDFFFCSFCATWDGAGTSSDAYSECAYLPLPLTVQDSCCTHWASCILVPASGFEPNQCSFAHMLFRFNNSCEMPEIQLPSQKHKPFECPSLSEKRRALDPQLCNFDHS